MTRRIKDQQGLEATQPGVSSRRNGLGLKKTTFNRITKEDLDLRPYYLQESQNTNAATFSPRQRVQFARRQHANQAENPNYIYRITWTDEAGLTVNGKTLGQLSHNF